LIKKETKLQREKNKNITPGFLSGRLYFIMGNRSMLIADPPQFIIVENGKKFGSTISGIYIQTIGPRDSPKLAMKVNRPNRMNTTDALGFDLLMKNPIAIIRFVTTDPITPP
jgi:hypothetical protein